MKNQEQLMSADVINGCCYGLITDSLFWRGIGRGQMHHEEEETEGSTGSGGLDHLVAGAAGGDQVRGGGWRSTERARDREGGGGRRGALAP